MKYNPITRRHFLQGLGQSLMVLPVLPSLMTEKAYAQAISQQSFYVLINGDHGGTGRRDWYPAPFNSNPESAMFATKMILPAGQNDIDHVGYHAPLAQLMTSGAGHPAGNVDMGRDRISYILGSFLNPHINKLNVISGIDGSMSYYGHSRGVSGGNIWFRGYRPDNTSPVDLSHMGPTIDQFLAESPKFYADPTQNSLRVFVRGGNSYDMLGQGVRSSGTRIDHIYNAIFSKFRNGQTTEALQASQEKQYLIDRVIEDYKRLTTGSFGAARKISSADKQRVEQHAELLFQVQKKYKRVINSCSDVTGPTNTRDFREETLTEYNRTWDMMMDLIAAGIQCGATRLANLSGNIVSHIHKGDYHQEVAHAASNSPEAQLKHNLNFRWMSEHIFGAMVSRLDSIDLGNGQKLLDKGMVMWMLESGTVTHGHTSLGLVTAGSINGFFKTGQMVDFSNRQNLGLLRNYQAGGSTRPGMPSHRLFANILQAFGIQPSEYRRNNLPGFGDSRIFAQFGKSRGNTEGHIAYPLALRNSFDEKLPMIT